MKLTGADIAVAALIEQGVDVVFGYPGGNAINLYDALYKQQDKIRHVLTSHEQGAAHAADGYARSTGKTGVCVATSGPGATNLVTGIATAYLDSIPIVAITCNVPVPLLGRDTFQEVDITGVTVPITKHNYFVKDVSRLAEIVKEAFAVANSGRPGPVLIDIPKDITAELHEYVSPGRFQKRRPPAPPAGQLETAAALLRECERPLIYFGGGVLSSGAEEELQAFAKKIHSPLTSSAMGLSAVPYNYPLYLGLVGMHGTPSANWAVANSDLLIAVGARFSDRVTGDKSKFAAGAKVVHIDIDASEHGKNIPTFHDVTGDAGEILSALTEMVEQKNNAAWAHDALEFKAKHPMPAAVHETDIDPRDVLHAIRACMGDAGILVTDVGQHQMIAAQHYRFGNPHTFLSSCGLGTMGYGMGAAVGAKIGNPDTPVALITGDGCFHMDMNELAVAVTEQLPIVVVVMNNGVLGMVRQWQKLFYAGRYSATTMNRQTDFVKLAEALGAVGMRMETKEQVVPTVQAAFAAGRPVVIDCIINRDEAVFPIIPPGGTQEDMIYAN